MSDATNRIDAHWPAGTPQDDHQRGWNLGNMAGQQEGYEQGRADERRRVLKELSDWTVGRYIDRMSLAIKLDEMRREEEPNGADD